MSKTVQIPGNRRILVIDDNPSIHDDFRKILGKPPEAEIELEAAEAVLFGTVATTWFEIDTASQGREGLEKVERSLAEGRPYSLAFVDVRMPPGWNGIETIEHIWEVCPDLQIVICTAYSDCSWEDMRARLRPLDRMLILKKPFDTIEVLQMANALTEKWRLLQESKARVGTLEEMVRQRTLELQTSEQRFREQASLLDKARDGILVRHLEKGIVYWNKSAERIFGWTAEEAIGRRMRDLVGRDATDFEEACRQVLARGEWAGEQVVTVKDGRKLIIDARWTLVRGADNEPESVLAIHTDVTDHKRLEQQFLRAQRLESIGTLAGGIAHDLNNVFAPITMGIDLLKLNTQDAKSKELLATVSGCARRGSEMVNQVLSFARGVEGQRIEVQVKHLLSEVGKIVRETFPKNIQIEIQVGRDLQTLFGDPTQLHQVILNLCVNARDSMPHGGRIRIEASNVELSEDAAALELDAKPGPHVRIQVSDSGAGIPPEHLDKIFDPFFTTKKLGKGTGLGLSTSLTIVRSHGGFMAAASEVGKGTVFTVHLPARAGAVSPAATQNLPALPRGAGEMILVVDDEAPIRQVARQTLEAFGYRVLLAADGEQACTLYAQHSSEIALVFTDMMMPVLDGPGLIREISQNNPGVKIIAASGITIGNETGGVSVPQAKKFLAKPYTAEALLVALQEVLHS